MSLAPAFQGLHPLDPAELRAVTGASDPPQPWVVFRPAPVPGVIWNLGSLLVIPGTPVGIPSWGGLH